MAKYVLIISSADNESIYYSGEFSILTDTRSVIHTVNENVVAKGYDPPKVTIYRRVYTNEYWTKERTE